MRTWIWSGLGLAATVALAGPAHPVSPKPSQRVELSDDLRLLKIGEGAFVIAHCYPFLSNALLVEMPDRSFVMVGTPCTPEATALVLAWIEKTYGKRKITAINTGYHPDNLGGNAALLQAGHAVYGSERSVKLLQERGEYIRKVMLSYAGAQDSRFYQTFAALQCVPPSHQFPIQEGLCLEFGGEKVQVIFPGPSQAPDKVAVYFPARKLLFGGCMVLAGERAGNLAEANLQSWAEALRKLRPLAVDVVVAGHGERLDPGLIPHTLEVLARSSQG